MELNFIERLAITILGVVALVGAAYSLGVHHIHPGWLVVCGGVFAIIYALLRLP